MNVLAAVLAAGASRRLGRPKQALEIEGVALLTRAVEAALTSRATRVVAVLGHDAERLRALVPAPAVVLVNDRWEEGMASSIRAAVAFAREQEAAVDALLVAVCDQPALDAAVLDGLIDAWTASRPWAAAACYDGRPGVPAVFDRTAFDGLADLTGDRGARDLLRADPSRVVKIDWPDGAHDVDRDADDPNRS